MYRDRLSQGVWPSLRELILKWNMLSSGSVARLMSSLQGTSNALMKLTINRSTIGPEGGKAIAMGMKEGACPYLQELDLTFTGKQGGRLWV